MIRVQVNVKGEWTDYAVVNTEYVTAYVRYARSRGYQEVRLVDVNA